jgi:AcrR family transcriptional regulator
MQERSLETRKRIIGAAMILFAQSGYQVTSVAHICDSAGVSKGAFYHHFPSKQDVFRQAMEEWLETINVQITQAREAGISVPEALAQMATFMPGVYQAATEGLPMFLEFLTQAYREPELLEAMTSPTHYYRELFSDMVEDGIAEGSLREMDTDTASRVIVGLAMGLLLQGLVDPKGADWPQVASEGISLLMKGFLRR